MTKECAGVACQIAYEYENVGNEHISDMYDTYEGEAPFSFDVLEDATYEALKLRKEGLSYDDALKKLGG
jgi:hypothetical protein